MGSAQYGLFLGAIFFLARPVGLYVVRVFDREPTRVDRRLCPIESRLHRICGIKADEEMAPVSSTLASRKETRGSHSPKASTPIAGTKNDRPRTGGSVTPRGSVVIGDSTACTALVATR